jgi:hypothetical protein
MWAGGAVGGSIVLLASDGIPNFVGNVAHDDMFVKALLKKDMVGKLR